LNQSEIGTPGSFPNKFRIDANDLTLEPIRDRLLELFGRLNHDWLVGGGKRHVNFVLIDHSGCDNSLFKPMVIGCLFKGLLCFLVLVVAVLLGYGCTLRTGKVIPFAETLT
jgi:hypothetical protein